MPKKRLSLPPENERVRYLLDFLFDGNQSKMADAIGTPQPVISRVVTGRIRVGNQLVAALSGHPKVNPVWLVTGKGDPLLAAGASTSAGWPVPVAPCLLPGRLADCEKMLTSLVHYVSGAVYRTSLYMAKAHHCVSLEMEELRILPDDLLLIESDPSVWEQNIRRLNRRLVVVRIQAAGLQEAVLSEVQVPEHAEAGLISFSVEQSRERLAQRVQAEEARKEHGREHRAILMPGESSAKSERKPARIEPSQIAGLVIQLIRNF